MARYYVGKHVDVNCLYVNQEYIVEQYLAENAVIIVSSVTVS